MAASFNTTIGLTNIISTPYTGVGTQIITIMCWVYLNGATPANYRDIITIDPNIYMQIFTDGVSIDFGTANNDHVGQVLQTNTWYHVAQVIVPTSLIAREIYGYVNGKLNVNVADGDISIVFTNICIGSSIFSGEIFPLNGNVRDVRIWTRQLNATEIVDEMNSGIPVHKQSLLLWAPLDDNLRADKSGNNNVLTVGSAITLQSGPLKSFPKKHIK